MDSKPRRAQGGLGLLSRSIPVPKSQQSIPLFPREEREEERTRRRMRRAPDRGAACVLSRKRREGEGEGVFKVPTQGSKISLDSN